MKGIPKDPPTPQETPDNKPRHSLQEAPSKVVNPFVMTITHSVGLR